MLRDATGHRTDVGRAGRRRLAGALVAGAAVLAAAAPAMADTATITITDTAGRSDPAAGVARVLTVTGNSSVPVRVWIAHREPGGAPCAPTYSSDTGSRLRGFRDFEAPSANGDFSFSRVVTWPDAGPEMFCIWLPPGGSSGTITSPISQVIDFRSPVSTVSVTQTPAPAPVDRDFRVTVAGSTEAPSELYVAIANPGAACGATPAADVNPSLVYGRDINGAFSLDVDVPGRARGDHAICTWIGGSSDDTSPGAAPRRFPIRVGAVAAPASSTTPTFIGVRFPQRIGLRRIVPIAARVGSTAGTPRGTCFVQRFIARRWENIASAGLPAGGVCRMTIRMGRRGNEQLRIRFRGADGFGASVSPYRTVRVA